jgi:YihY family inner membrane protein
MSTTGFTQDSKANNMADSTQAEETALAPQRAAGESNPSAAPPVPISHLRPVVPQGGLWPQMVALAKYMVRTEVHTYAFSVAANVILSLFPFIVMMLTISRVLFHNQSMVQVVDDMMTYFLPSNQHFIISSMTKLVHPNKGMQVYSVVMLLISCTGIFLPLEVALNGVWGVRKNRSYLHNQVTSLGLALLIGVLTMSSVALDAGQRWILDEVFLHHTDNVVYTFLNGSVLSILGVATGILIFFLIYWILPNRKVPARAVLPTSIVIGLLWAAAKYLYVLSLPRLDFYSVYGPFYVSVGLMIWAFLSGLLLLAGAHFSATRYALKVAREEERQQRQQEGIEDAQENGVNA